MLPRRAVLAAVGLVLAATALPATAQDSGRDIYMERCFWCHGEQGLGDGPSAEGMVPRPRDFVAAEYKIRSTPSGSLPTDDDLFDAIARGRSGTPMTGWETILDDEEIRGLVSYLKSLSPRFATATREPIAEPPSQPGSAERGAEVYQRARCFMCHGNAGRGDGGITAALNYQWGLSYSARDFTRGWTFKGRHESRDIYMRITGGLSGTPMGPFADYLSDQERWDLAHYITSLDEEPAETSEDFVVAAVHIDDEIPGPTDEAWNSAPTVTVPLAGQVVLDPPFRWWVPTVGSVSVQALWNDAEIGLQLEWDDPTGPADRALDSALLQFAKLPGGKPYFLFGDADNPVQVWQWHADGSVEEWTATGSGQSEYVVAQVQVDASWSDGRWHAVFRRQLLGEPEFQTRSFVPVLFSIRDGANGEFDNTRAISTWLYATLEPPGSQRSWLLALVWVLGAVIVELWLVGRLQS